MHIYVYWKYIYENVEGDDECGVGRLSLSLCIHIMPPPIEYHKVYKALFSLKIEL